MEGSGWAVVVGGFGFANAVDLRSLESTMFGEVLHIGQGELIEEVFPSWVIPLSVLKVS